MAGGRTGKISGQSGRVGQVDDYNWPNAAAHRAGAMSDRADPPVTRSTPARISTPAPDAAPDVTGGNERAKRSAGLSNIRRRK